MADRPDEDEDEAVPASGDLLESTQRSFDELCADVSQALTRRHFGTDPPRFGEFEVRGVLGKGGYGCVFQAWDPTLDREVAIKLCPVDSAMDAAILLAEARALAKLSHPNIITIHEYAAHGDMLFLVMEYVRGGSLYEYAVDAVPETWPELVKVFADAARGIAAAHREGIIHGDIKPDNVLLHEDLRPRVADFGLARFVDKPALMPDAIGTVPYAAPELLAGQQMRDELTDQWSFFVTLCHCIDGKLPMLDTNAPKIPSTDEKMLQVLEAWAGPSTLRTEIPDALAEVLRVGLSFDRRDRFSDMGAVVDALDKVFVGGLVAGSVAEPARTPVAEPDAVLLPTPLPEDVDRSSQGWASYLIGCLLFMAGVFAALSYPHVSWPWESTPESEQLEWHPPLDSADRAVSEEADPCVTDGIPIAPDTSVQSVCRALKADYQTAVDLWNELSAAREREAKSPQDWVELGYDTAILAQTLLRMAETADSERATVLRQAARNWVLVAQDRLLEASLLDENGDETDQAVSRVDSLADRILNPDDD